MAIGTMRWSRLATDYSFVYSIPSYRLRAKKPFEGFFDASKWHVEYKEIIKEFVSGGNSSKP